MSETLQELVARIEATPGYDKPAAWGVGLATVAPSGKVLDASFAVVNLGENYGAAAIVSHVLGHSSGTATYPVSVEQLDAVLQHFAPLEGDGGSHPNRDVIKLTRAAFDAAAPLGGSRAAFAVYLGSLGDAPVGPVDVYFRLHLLSNRKVLPNSISLEGLFGHLNNVVWTTLGPFDPDGFDLRRLELTAQGHTVHVHAVDKMPRMIDYVIPNGVRIAHGGRVRLGAHLADGTTVMHEGFCNFNAGTLGTAMVEGRISQGVIVGDHSDVGGGASIMGTLSGGGKEVVSMGERCLLGANSGIGIALGDDCVVEAGCYVTAGTLVKTPDGEVVKAKLLSGVSNLLYRRNSQTGAIEAIANKAAWTGLNNALHKN